MKRFSVCLITAFIICIAFIPARRSFGRGLINDTLGGILRIGKKNIKNTLKDTAALLEESSDEQPSAQPANASSSSAGAADASFPPEIYEKLDSLYIQIAADMKELGENILAYNKPAFEIKLTQKERELEESVNEAAVYSRVCVKGRTIVLGNAGKDKKFYPVWMIAGDEEFPPAHKGAESMEGYISGICISSDSDVIEAAVGMSLAEISEAQKLNGAIKVDDSGFNLAYISYRDGTITEILYCIEEPVSSKAWTFAHNKARKLGLSTFNK